MQASQRAEWNPALELAVRRANELRQPLVAVFGITDSFPEANLRHYAFMLEGLQEVQSSLRRRGVQLVVRHESPEKAAADMAQAASVVVTDRGYLRIQCAWREALARNAPCRVVQVEGDCVVPIEVASQKEEYSAATLRGKIQRHLERFLRPIRATPLRRDSLGLNLGGLDLGNLQRILNTLRVDKSVSPVQRFRGGTGEARRLLRAFIKQKLKDYASRRNDPSLDVQSHMSPYLHFGQISPVYIALQVQRAPGVSKECRNAFLEQLIVRRELAVNMVYYNWDYDSFKAVPVWARSSLERHRSDARHHLYAVPTLERARTNDPYWNAAQSEMVLTGKMHSYMRMYWGKKLIEWSRTAERAYRVALYLNNKYELDGRDPNSFAGIAWCFGKHDRPWPERPIFGKVRYMNAAGLRRKFDVDAYVRKIEALKRDRAPA